MNFLPLSPSKLHHTNWIYKGMYFPYPAPATLHQSKDTKIISARGSFPELVLGSVHIKLMCSSDETKTMAFISAGLGAGRGE